MNRLNCATLPLAGTHLIEASAGTGKTYTIGLVVLRLLLEKKVRMQNLALVTFTEAAAAELAQRIVRFLDEARAVVQGGEAALEVSAVVTPVVEREGAQGCLALLDRAVMELELARITTIHGFCRRILDEFAFELGGEGGYDIVTSQADLIEEILADFWRNELTTLDPRFQSVVRMLTPARLALFFAPLFAFSGVEVDGPPYDRGEVTRMVEAYEQLAQLWREQRGELVALLTRDRCTFKQTSYKVERIGGYADGVDALFGEQSFDFAPLRRFGYGALAAGRKDTTPPALPPALTVPAAIDSFLASYEPLSRRLVAGLQKAAWEYLQGELARRKARGRLRSFDDLIMTLARGLERNGERAAAPIRARFSAVLVDEFQDTDGVQYSLFATLFANRPDTFFAMIGDPKQAIYGFRGGDITAYLRARDTVTADNRHTLGYNFRTTPRLLAALGAVYAGCASLGREPFQTGDIRCEPVEPGRTRLCVPLQNGRELPALTLWHYGGATACDLHVVARMTAARIRELVATAQVGEEGARRAVTCADIAILVKNHRTAALFKRELARAGIRSVTGRALSVGESAEAGEVELLLRAVLEPSNDSAVREMLLSGLFSYDLAELERWSADTRRRARLHGDCETCRTLWTHWGVARALVWFLTRHGVYGAPPCRGEEELLYERRLTNVRHLIELLHREDERLGRIPERTVQRFAQMRRETGNEAYEQRLESDGAAVQIVTMHKAKGLQWPVVFAVELWREMRPGTGVPVLNEGGRWLAGLDPQRGGEWRAQIEAQAWQEYQRLAYVALTRAESLLYVVTATRSREKKGGGAVVDRSPAAWLLCGDHIERLVEQGVIARCGVQEPQMGAALSPPASGADRACERWSGPPVLHPRWTVGSYSGLTRTLRYERPPGVVERTPARGIFAFPRGAGPGTVLHTIFEMVDFRGVRDGVLARGEQEKIAGILRRGGLYSDESLAAVLAMVTSVLTVALFDHDPSFTLSSLERVNRSAEMPFCLSAAHPESGIPPLSLQRLREVVGMQTGTIAAETFLAGFMTGIIDLVFVREGRWYLLDWKSNHLGNDAQAYAPPALHQAMDGHHYHLQYLLYTVALQRHLQLVTGGGFDYERDFGGVVYLFVRGVDGSHDSEGNLHGVFRARPERELIERVSGLL